MTGGPAADAIAAVFRAEFGRAVAILARVLGDVSDAEDAVQDAYAQALRRWPETGVPDNPAGWIVTVARNRAIDRLRRERALDERRAELARRATERLMTDPVFDSTDEIPDERLRLIFTCCHPALAREAQVALTLRLVGGLTVARDRPRAALQRGRRRPAARARQAQAARGRRPAARAGRRRAARRGWPPCWPWSTSSSTRATRRPPGPSCCATTSPARRCAWARCWSS